MDVPHGGPWRDLPECYGKWITVYQRFNRWSRNGAMERLFTALQEERIIAVEVRVLAMDSTSVKVHQHAVVPPKRNRTDPWDYDRLDATFLANLQLILITIQLKNASKTN